MHDPDVFDEALRLLTRGLNAREAADAVGVPWGTVRDWQAGGRQLVRTTSTSNCPDSCPWLPPRNEGAYAYLLGLYLGDGTIQKVGRTLQLRVFLDDRYPAIQDACVEAIGQATPASVARGAWGSGCTAIKSVSKHWPCFFPQHGPGRKHERDVSLAPWQEKIADAYPQLLLRGLIHSDGCRDANHVGGKSYPRYSFSNRSQDVHAVFRRAAECIGVKFRNQRYVTTIARREDVARLDEFIGPKA